MAMRRCNRGPVDSQITYGPPAKKVKDLYKNVNELLPQLGRRWGVLCCRVTQKSEFIPSANGSYLILTVADLTGEIRVKIFGSAAKRYMDQINEDCVYTIKGGGKIVDAEFANYMTVQHKYEVVVTDATSFVPLDVKELPVSKRPPHFPLNPSSFLDILRMDPAVTSAVDVVGMLHKVHTPEEVEEFVGRDKKVVMKKRQRLVLQNESLNKLDLFVYGNFINKFCASRHPILAVKGANFLKAVESENNSLISMYTTTIKVEPIGVEEVAQMLVWKKNVGLDLKEA